MPSHTCQIIAFVARSSNTLIGFADVATPSGLVFHGIGIHRKGDLTWISPPGKPVLDRDGCHAKDATGKGRWTPTVSFASKDVREKFTANVLDALRISNPDALA